jgi:hypothetical protein
MSLTAVTNLAGLGSVHRERLLDQHVLARSQREDRVVVVHRVRRRNVDHVDVRIGDKRLVAGMRVRDAELVRETVRGSLAARPDCDVNAGVGQPEIGHERAGDPTRSEDSPPHWAVRHAFIPSSTGIGESLTTWPAARLASGARWAGIWAPRPAVRGLRSGAIILLGPSSTSAGGAFHGHD